MPDNIVNVDYRRHFHLQPGDRFLDLGCGNGRHTLEACRWPVRAVGADIGREDLLWARDMLAEQRRLGIAAGRGDFILADAQHLPFRDGAFDRVVCTEVLEHVPDDREAIRELDRVLKPGGEIAVSVPRYWPEKVFWTLSWGYWHTPGGHVRQYRPGVMHRYLEEQGLEVWLTRYRHSFQTAHWFLRCVFGKDRDDFLPIKFATKFINWHHHLRVPVLERLEATLNLVAGKDMILYARKPARSASKNGARPLESAH